jgi:Resolvase, N terminal domain
MDRLLRMAFEKLIKTGGRTMTFFEAISSGFRNYVGFSGRASRSEFWYWILFTADNPHATKLTVHILAAVAEHEREMISERTRAALKAAKARGTRLGNPQLAKAAKRGTAAVKTNARQFAANVLPIIEEIERSGVTSHNAIAAKLNERNVRTARGGKWTHVQVGAVLRPFDASAVGLQ